MYKNLLTINERILLYLSSYSYNSNSWDASDKLTANSIAEAVCCNRSNLTYNLNDLMKQKYLSEIKSHIIGKNKKQKINFLTKDGKRQAEEIKKKLMDTQIKIYNLDNKEITLPFYDVKIILLKTIFVKESLISNYVDS